MFKMAIVKVTYTKNKDAAKKSVRYMQHRPGKDGARESRTLFNSDGELTKREAYWLIDTAKTGSLFFRIVISPDPKQEDTGRDLYMPQIIEQTMLSLEERVGCLVPWLATEHSDHAPHRHVHVLAALPGKLTRADLQALRQTATQDALGQRQERDLAGQARARAIEEAQWAL